MAEANLKLILCNQFTQAVADTAIDDLCKTYSTSHCHHCLENMEDAVLLLDKQTRVIYVSSKVEKIMNKLQIAYSLNSKFILPAPHHAGLFAAFVNHNEVRTLFLLIGEQEQDELLLTCFRLPAPVTPNLNVARYLIKLRDSHHHAVSQWQFFTEQFTLTQAETRLCHDLTDGLTLNDYCNKWHVTISTARSQLHSVFAKTNTKRQSDLLRLIYLFTRT